MQVLDFIFGNTYSDLVFNSINIVMFIGSYYWWRKYKHRDYLWLSVSFGIFLTLDAIGYLTGFFLPEQSSSLGYLIYFVIETTIDWAAVFYLLLIMVKWSIVWTPRRGKVIGWLMSRKGVVAVTIASLVLSIGMTTFLYVYLT